MSIPEERLSESANSFPFASSRIFGSVPTPTNAEFKAIFTNASFNVTSISTVPAPAPAPAPTPVAAAPSSSSSELTPPPLQGDLFAPPSICPDEIARFVNPFARIQSKQQLRNPFDWLKTMEPVPTEEDNKASDAKEANAEVSITNGLDATLCQKEDGDESEGGKFAKLMLMLEEEIKCSVCIDTCYEPITLLCGHSACHDCLKKCFKVKKACPECRHAVHPLGELKVNTKLKSIINLVYPSHEAERKKEKEKELVAEAEKFKTKFTGFISSEASSFFRAPRPNLSQVGAPFQAPSAPPLFGAVSPFGLFSTPFGSSRE